MARTAVTELADEAAPWIEGLARVGYIAIGTVYAIVGAMAVAAGVRGRGEAPDKNDALRFLIDQPFGKVLLFVITTGLLGYALWRIICGVNDSERRGSEAKGLALRAGSIIRGIFYTGVAFEIGRFATRGGGMQSSDQSAKHWTGRLMQKPYGEWVVAAAGLAIIGAGIYQLTNAWRAKLSSQLRLGNSRHRRLIVAISRFGIAARGIVFSVVGASILIAAIRHNPQQAEGSSGAMSMLARPLGGGVLIALGLGLVAYGIYSLVNAKYRRIAPEASARRR
jgi:hypothetical protein